MAGSLTFRPPREGDIETIVADMRDADRDELDASGALPHVTMLARSLAFSVNPGVAMGEHGKVVAIFGLAPLALMGDTAAPWMIGTTGLTKHPTSMVKAAARYFTQSQQQYPKLLNYVDARNVLSVRWLKRMGFEIDDPAPYGPFGFLFHRFHKGLGNV